LRQNLRYPFTNEDTLSLTLAFSYLINQIQLKWLLSYVLGAREKEKKEANMQIKTF